MEFLGLSAAQLGGLLAAAAGAIVVLYILKLRRRRVAVPFSRLWQRVVVERPSSSLFSQLKRLISLLVQLALAALLLFAAADPRVRATTPTGRHQVVLLDGSASMSATDVPGGRAGAARQAVRRMIQELGAADRMLLAQMDSEITPLSPLTDDLAALENGLREYRPRDTGLDFARALRFALDALRGLPNAELVVVGDGAYAAARDGGGDVRIPADVTLRHLSVGRSGRNVGISAFSARRYPLDKSRYEVLIEVQNFSDRAEQVELTLSADGAATEVTRLDLGPRGSIQRVLGDQSGANETLQAAITLADGTHDDLPADDRAYATLPARRRARVLAISPGNLYLSAGLLLDEYLNVQEATPESAPGLLREGRWDVVVEDGIAVPVPPGTRVLYLRPSGPDSPLELDATTVESAAVPRPFFDRIESRHPVLRWTSDLEDTNIGTATRYRVRSGDRVIAASERAPLIVAGERGGGRFVALAFDVRASDLPLRVSWPVFLINVIDWFAGDDPAYLSSFATGSTWRIPVPAGVESAEMTSPDGRVLHVPVIDGRAVTRGLVTGFYRLRAGPDAQIIAANLSDPDESNCAPRPRLDVGGTSATAPQPGRTGLRRELWVYLLGAALGIVVVEWLTFHRRVTV